MFCYEMSASDGSFQKSKLTGNKLFTAGYSCYRVLYITLQWADKHKLDLRAKDQNMLSSVRREIDCDLQVSIWVCGNFETLPVFVLTFFLFLLQNGTEDTALHSASQFGQSLVVAVLLEVRYGEKDELKKGVAFLIIMYML